MPIHDWTKVDAFPTQLKRLLEVPKDLLMRNKAPRQTPDRLCKALPVFFGCALCLTAIGPRSFADDAPAAKSTDEGPGKVRMETMRSAIEDLKSTSSAIDDAAALTFVPRPLLRYNDQTRTIANTRELLDATVWRLGERGRPTALVTLEIYPLRPGMGRMFYEFVSLSPSPFAMQSERGPRWSSPGTELKMSPLAGAPKPANSAPARLTQMRQLARRFSVHEVLAGDKIECRLLPQPVDRYADEDADIRDAAIFLFANGTNPEIGVLLECSDAEWSFGAFRLSSAASTVDFDGRQVFETAELGQWPVTAPYTAKNHDIELPEAGTTGRQ